MTKKSTGCLILAALLFMGSGVFAQTNDEAAKQMKWLLQFKGKWKSDNATMVADGKTVHFPYSANFIITPDNHGLYMTEQANIPGMGKMIASNLAGVSPYDAKVHWFSVDNIDVAHEHVGSFTDNKHFSMVHRSIQNGKEFVETITVEFPNAGTLNLTVENVLDNKQVALITGTFKRSGS